MIRRRLASLRRREAVPFWVAVIVGVTGCTEPQAGPEPATVDGIGAVLEEIRAGMVAIPAGTFLMGSESGVAGADEHPVREVRLERFHLGAREVTAGQYRVFLAATGRETPPVDPALPAVNVSWNDAQAFIDWLNAQTGERYRLPSEAEWEYAARAGSAQDYWWGESFSRDHVNGTGTGGRDQWIELAPAGRFPPNAFGLHDILGNAWEWTADCYAETYDGAPVDGSPRAGDTPCGRVLRGGSWSDIPAWLRVSTRNWFDEDERFDYVGFRLARD